MEGRTIYPTTVRRADEVNRVLKPGYNSAKIGDVVRKGRWRGLHVFTLTLEERATCPTTCKHWRSCYGNNVYQGERLIAEIGLQRRIQAELHELAQAYQSFVVRLHILGDFWSVDYVDFWSRMLDLHPGLKIFGYSARIDEKDPIAQALASVIKTRWDRFAVRLSNAPVGERTAVTVEHPYQVPPEAILCPAQIGRTASCTTCALCWQTSRPIAFLQH